MFKFHSKQGEFVTVRRTAGCWLHLLIMFCKKDKADGGEGQAGGVDGAELTLTIGPCLPGKGK